MYLKATDYEPKEIYKFIRQSINKTHKEIAQQLNKSTDWSKSNENGRQNYKFKDILDICRKNNIEMLLVEKGSDNKK